MLCIQCCDSLAVTASGGPTPAAGGSESHEQIGRSPTDARPMQYWRGLKVRANTGLVPAAARATSPTVTPIRFISVSEPASFDSRSPTRRRYSGEASGASRAFSPSRRSPQLQNLVEQANRGESPPARRARRRASSPEPKERYYGPVLVTPRQRPTLVGPAFKAKEIGPTDAVRRRDPAF